MIFSPLFIAGDKAEEEEKGIVSHDPCRPKWVTALAFRYPFSSVRAHRSTEEPQERKESSKFVAFHCF